MGKRKPYLFSSLLVAGVLALGACVTINVYFPAAEAQEAAEEFVEKVLGDDAEAAKPAGGNPQAWQAPAPEPDFDLMSLFISSAHAQNADITIRTPAIQAIQDRMAARFQTSLQAHFDSGAFRDTLAGLVAIPSTSQEEAHRADLDRYLGGALKDWLARLGFEVSIHDNPAAGAGPILVGLRTEGEGPVERGQGLIVTAEALQRQALHQRGVGIVGGQAGDLVIDRDGRVVVPLPFVQFGQRVQGRHQLRVHGQRELQVGHRGGKVADLQRGIGPIGQGPRVHDARHRQGRAVVEELGLADLGVLAVHEAAGLFGHDLRLVDVGDPSAACPGGTGPREGRE